MAHEYTATVRWERGEAAFTDRKYSRAHTWSFDGGTVVPASSSPHSVRVPFSRPDAVDPEEAFVASLSSCHMLWFLAIAAKRGFRIDSYTDAAVGIMDHNAAGKLAITAVTLRPKIVCSGEFRPTPADLEAMHELAHEECFIANSVTSTVRIEASAE